MKISSNINKSGPKLLAQMHFAHFALCHSLKSENISDNNFLAKHKSSGYALDTVTQPRNSFVPDLVVFHQTKARSNVKP